MDNNNSSVEKHYSREGLFETILQKLADSGIDKSKVTRNDVAGVDEFHIKGAEVSVDLAKEAGFNKDSKVLDVGCGIGGPARMIADEFGCKVTGIDLTGEFIRTARQLSELLGMQTLTEFIQADATNMPFEDGSFDDAWTQHVQMNIGDKKELYSEVRRVLKKGGRFIYYDIFSTGKGTLIFPLPWATEDSLSHLITLTDYERVLGECGFRKLTAKDRTQESMDFFQTVFENSAGNVPKIGLGILMRESTDEKLRNVFKNLSENNIEVQSGIYEAI